MFDLEKAFCYDPKRFRKDHYGGLFLALPAVALCEGGILLFDKLKEHEFPLLRSICRASEGIFGGVTA